MWLRIASVFLIFALAGCDTSPRLMSPSGGHDNPASREFVVGYTPAYGWSERDAYMVASRRCSPRVATRVWHEFTTIFPMDQNLIGYRCD